MEGTLEVWRSVIARAYYCEQGRGAADQVVHTRTLLLMALLNSLNGLPPHTHASPPPHTGWRPKPYHHLPFQMPAAIASAAATNGTA